MSTTLAFDVYGTLIDTHGIVAKLRDLIGSNAEEFSRTWRDKQLEYSFRRGLMQSYENFTVCTSNALDYTCSYHNILLPKNQKDELLNSYRTLPAFDDVAIGLDRLKSADFRMYALSNGDSKSVDVLLVTAGIRDYFLGIVSVDDIKTFKPNPAVYHYFLSQSGASADTSWLISSNPFDVIGAISAGMNSAWVRRSNEAVFDPWGIEPTIIVESLYELSREMPRGR